MTETEIEDFLQKVESGLQEAHHNMLVEKALHNRSVVVSDGKGMCWRFLHGRYWRSRPNSVRHSAIMT